MSDERDYYTGEPVRSAYWQNVDAGANERRARADRRDECDKTPRGVFCPLCLANHQRDGDKVGQ